MEEPTNMAIKVLLARTTPTLISTYQTLIVGVLSTHVGPSPLVCQLRWSLVVIDTRGIRYCPPGTCHHKSSANERDVKRFDTCGKVLDDRFKGCFACILRACPKTSQQAKSLPLHRAAVHVGSISCSKMHTTVNSTLLSCSRVARLQFPDCLSSLHSRKDGQGSRARSDNPTEVATPC